MSNAFAALFGLALGGWFLWLALRRIDADELTLAVSGMALAPILIAMGVYWCALGLRVVRWGRLLREIGSAPSSIVAETLVIGYAVNNVLPARLGELFRADYAKRRFGYSRSTILGSILIERMLDLAVVLSCLVLGLLFADILATAGIRDRFELIAISATIVVGIAILGVYVLRSGEFSRLPVPAAAARLLRDFAFGIESLNRRSLALAALLSSAIWMFEILALWCMFSAVDIHLTVAESLLVMGAISLSTLVPTAPGYIGTYQLVAVLAMTAFGYSHTHGVVAASGIQLFLFGSVTLAGISMLVIRSLARLQDEGDDEPHAA